MSSADARKEFIRSSIASAVLAAPGGALRAKEFLGELGAAVASAACVDTFLDTPGWVVCVCVCALYDLVYRA